MIEAVLFYIGDTLIHFLTSQSRRFLTSATPAAYNRLVEAGHYLSPFDRYERTMWRRFVRSFVWAPLTRREPGLLATMRTVQRRLGLSLADDGLPLILEKGVSHAA